MNTVACFSAKARAFFFVWFVEIKEEYIVSIPNTLIEMNNGGFGPIENPPSTAIIYLNLPNCCLLRF